jgi:hypothetical protein
MFSIFWVFTLRAMAPCDNSFIVISPELICKYGVDDSILRAFISLESGFKEDAVNPITGARGILQILPPMVTEVNRIMKEYDLPEVQFTWDDAWDAEKSIEIWYIVQSYHNLDYDVKKACRLWFGVGTQYDGLTWGGYHKLIQKRILT